MEKQERERRKRRKRQQRPKRPKRPKRGRGQWLIVTSLRSLWSHGLKKNILIPREEKFSFFQKHREKERKKIETPPPTGYIPEWVWERSRTIEVLADHVRWLATTFGAEEAQRVFDLYEMGMTEDRIKLA